MEEEDDLLDELLETMNKSMNDVPQVRSSEDSSPETSLGITFSFPGWGFDISRNCKRQMSLVRHSGSETMAENHPTEPFRKMDWTEPRPPTDSSPVSGVPDELLVRIFDNVQEKDLLACRQVCKRWYRMSSSDCLWEKNVPVKRADGCTPRWLLHKHSQLLLQMRNRSKYPTKYYECLIEALDAWWDGYPCGRFSSTAVHTLFYKAALSDWCVFYDMLSWAFSRRADYLADFLVVKLGSSQFSKKEEEDEAASASSYGFHVQNDLSHPEGAARAEVCELMCSFWHRYISWVKRISLHCGTLNNALEAQRTVDTPKLYNKAVISFRSQVVLGYRLRQALQAGLSWLSTRESKGTASEQDVELLCSLHHLLQELDVTDDLTLPHTSFTQAKFRRCFLDGESSKEYSRAQIIAARMEYM